MAATKCCFCGRTVDQVTHLIQGPELFICDICVDACVDTLATKDHGWRERQIDYLLRLRNRRTLAPGRLGSSQVAQARNVRLGPRNCSPSPRALLAILQCYRPCRLPDAR
jgi:hypothetical protein